VLGAYRPLFKRPRSLRLVATSLAARLAIGISFVPLILVAKDATDSYALAGIVTGGFSAGVAVGAPVRGRLVDRHGAARAIPPLLVVSAGALIALPLLAETGSAELMTIVAALGGLTTPPFVASMRVEWQGLLGEGHPRLAQAYAFEAAAQTSMFVIGPLLAGAGVAAIGARATLAASGTLLLAGGLAFASQAMAAPRAERVAGSRSPIRLPGVRTLVLATLLGDVALGVIDVTVVAFADHRGERSAGGVLLAVFCAGAVAGALLYGARRWRGGAAAQLAVVLGLGTALLAPLAAAESLLVLAALLIVAGAPSAAQWSAASLTLDAASGGSAGAEAYTWLSAANSVGLAAGSALAGSLIESSGTDAAFLSASAATAVAAAVVLARRRTIA
jgi:MFS family permease